MPKRIDTFKIDGLQKNSAGVLTGKFRAAKVGVFPYFDYNLGKVVYELKHPDHMLTPEVVSQLNYMPITDNHPWGMVNLGNATDLVKGLTGSNASVNGDFLEVDGGIFDPVLVAKVLTKEQDECSLGYECDLLETPGTFQGVAYDRIQSNYNYNHLAMVPEGRCGPECKAIIDGKEELIGVQLRQDAEGKPILPEQKRSDQVMKTIKIDGREFQVPEEVGARLDTLTQENQTLTGDKAILTADRDGWKGKYDALKLENDGLKGNPPVDQKKIDQAVTARISLVNDAAEFEVEVKTDGTETRSDRQVKIDCIKKVDAAFDATGKSDDYINAFFDSLLVQLKDSGTVSSVGANNLRDTPRGDAHQTKIDALKEKRLNQKKS